MALTDEEKMKMRRVKNEIDTDSRELERMIDIITQKFETELDNYMAEIRTKLDNRDELTDYELEEMALRVPVYMYFTSEGLENIGLAYDSSKMTKLEAFNRFYEDLEGTINDKKAAAELKSLPEHYMEIVFSRAYKRVKTKLEMCGHLCLSIRKVIGKRTQDLFMASQEIEE